MKAKTNEGQVEIQFVQPLLQKLGYNLADIDAKVPVTFREGRTGRKNEADFVVYGRTPHDKDTSLIVVEAKASWEKVDEASKAQAESYARNLLAPFCLLTNGAVVQVWQLQAAGTSILIFEGKVTTLDTRFGDLALLLGRDAAVEYAAGLAGKTILETAFDWGRYLDAERRRSTAFPASIARTLLGATGASTSGDSLLDSTAGAVVVAPSGLGKTTLARSLFARALAERIARGEGALPVEIPLTDLSVGQGLRDFAFKRLYAHKPGLTDTGLTAILHRNGLVLVCDGFDELTPTQQSSIETEAITLRRDFSRLQIFLLSRATSAPQVPLPRFELLPLTDQERRDLVILRDPTSPHGWYNPPPTIWDLCANPLLLRLVIDYRTANSGTFPSSLGAIFRGWLEQAVRRGPRNGLAAGRLEAALTALAVAAGPAGLTILQAEAAVGSAVPADGLESLEKLNLIEVVGDKVSFSHQALADYLRARHIAQMSPSDALSIFQTMTLDADSLMPVLLMGSLTSAALQDALWTRVEGLSLPTYLSVLRYRADLSAHLPTQDPDAASLHILSELQRGLEQPLQGFFPAVQHAVRRAILNEDADEIQVTGRANVAAAQLIYSLSAKPPEGAAVVVGKPPQEAGFTMHNLGMSGRSIDSGRLLAAQRLRKGLLEALKRRDLPGGDAWRMERLCGRLRLLAVEHGLPYEGCSLAEIAEVLEPDRDAWAGPLTLDRSAAFPISQVLDDIEALRASGKDELDLWFPTATRGEPPVEDLPRLIDIHFRRAQEIYHDLVSHGFGGVRDQLSFHCALPVRWTITLIPPRATPAWSRWSMHSWWMPVADWSQAGANVAFETADWIPDWDAYAEQTRLALASLGRDQGVVISYSSSGLPDFTGQAFNRAYHDGETSALREACDYLNADLERLFSDLPRD